VQRRQGLARGLDEGVVDLGRDVVAVQLARERVGVLAHLRRDRILLEHAVEGHAHRPLEVLPLAPERVEDLLAVVAARKLAIVGVRALVEHHFLAVGELHLRPRHVGVRKDRVDVPRLVGRELERGHQGFARTVERVRRGAQDGVQPVAIDGEPRFLAQEAFDALAAHGQDLGPDEGGGLADLRAQDLAPLVQREGGRRARVLGQELA
jgi:hypothetical protein